MEFEAVIGLEIHVELNSATKLFCDCPNRPGDEPNRNTCPTCLWFPGAAPRLGRAPLEKAALLSLGLGGELQPRSAFDQKVYYYPDLPKGYQLSQARLPLSRGGGIEITDEAGERKTLRIHHIHMEEDVARLVHQVEGRTPVSLVDFNRAGAPLVEIVTEPDFRSPFEAMEFLKALRTRVRYVGASDCSMDNGTMRVDANISIRPRGATVLNTKVEVKNMNSVRHVGDAIAFEIARQRAAVEAGEEVVLHTRLWDPDRKATLPMRGKFEGPCVPDPSVPVIELSPEWIARMRARLPEMPDARAARMAAACGFSVEEARFLCAETEVAEYFEALVREGVAPRMALHWMATQLLPALRERKLDPGRSPVDPGRLAALLGMLSRGEIHSGAAREVLLGMFESEEAPESLVNTGALRQESDAGRLAALVDQVLSHHPAAVRDIRRGQGRAIGFLIGQVLQASGGRANPRVVRELLHQRLSSGDGPG